MKALDRKAVLLGWWLLFPTVALSGFFSCLRLRGLALGQPLLGAVVGGVSGYLAWLWATEEA